MLRVRQAKQQQAAEKATRAVMELVLRAPLFGYTVLGTAIAVEEDEGIDTMCTDGQTIWYAPEWVLNKPFQSIVFDFLHETLHIIYNHVRRGGPRDARIWNYACDVRVAHDCLKILKGSTLDDDHVPAFDWAKDMAVEVIYDTLMQNAKQVPRSYEPDMKEPKSLSPEQEAEFRRSLTADIAQAKVVEEQRFKGRDQKDAYGDSIDRRLLEIERCDAPWDVMLHGNIAGSLGQDLARWAPPNRRYMPLIALPSFVSATEDYLLLGIDVSGSVTDEDIKRFRACIIPAASRARKITIITFDAIIRECITATRPEEAFDAVKFTTGDHSFTSVRPLFERAAELEPTVIAIITDGFIALPSRPHPNTHWVLTPQGRELPWGEHYRLQYSW